MIRSLTALHDRAFGLTEMVTVPLLTTLARFLFAAVLLFYYWSSALTKLGPGLFGIFKPSAGAYAQIFPKTFEAVGYDTSQLGWMHWAVAVAGMWAEFLLPLLIVLGLFTRLASLGMIGFLGVQTMTDLYGHGGLENGVLGRWFDHAPDGVVLDQRSFWVFLLLFLVLRGGGPISADRLLRSATWARPGALRPMQG